MWRFAIDALELPDEMELGGVGLIGDVVEVDGLRIVGIDEKLGLHKSSVEEYPGIRVCCHRGVFGWGCYGNIAKDDGSHNAKPSIVLNQRSPVPQAW